MSNALQRPIELIMSNLAELLTVCGRPAFVKAASEQVHAESYGIESREDVYLGYITALAGGGNTDRYAKVAAFWGIDKDIKTASDRWEAANKVTEPSPEDYLIDKSFGGTPVRKYAAYDLHSTIKAAQALYENRWRYPIEWRQEAAERCLTKVAAHGVKLTGCIDRYIKKAAGYASPSQDAIEEAISQRYAVAGKDPEFVKLAETLYKIAQDVRLRHDPEIVKVAMKAIDVFDFSLDDAVRAEIKVAEEICDILEEDFLKVANDLKNDYVELQNGSVVKVAELRKDVLEAVSPELAKMAADELYDVLPTLPRPDADLIVRLQHV